MSMQPPFPSAIPLTPMEQYLAGAFVPVQSTYCVAIAYRRDTAAIGVRFDDGQEWWYFPFDESAAKSFWLAPSKGQWCWGFMRVRGKGHIHDHRIGAARAK